MSHLTLLYYEFVICCILLFLLGPYGTPSQAVPGYVPGAMSPYGQGPPMVPPYQGAPPRPPMAMRPPVMSQGGRY